jgi:Zn-dependent M28 family amino/carboxypeptidase
MVCLSIVSFASTVEERVQKLSTEEMQSVIEFLGHDLLEGRAPGTHGGQTAEIYMRSLFKWMGLRPGAGDSYLQPFTLKGFTLGNLEASTGDVELLYREDIMGTYTGPDSNFKVEGGAVFVGFGITTGLWDWDDYKNVDVKDKIVIARVNDPGMFRDDIFEGKTLTYFGRWTYHIEEAARRGAKGILLIHTDESAGYGWHVVRNSWAGEEVFLPSDVENNLVFRGWIKESSLEKALAASKFKLGKLYKKSRSRRFKPIDLGFKVKLRGSSSQRTVANNNVVAEIPGKSDKRIVLSAHIDHLGMGEENGGDNIFNGAIDNGSAVAAMVLCARILKEMQEELFYSVTILACNAEEAGLLGSRHYAATTDRDSIIANINFESTPVWGKASDFMGVGARFSTLEDVLKEVVAEEGLEYSYFSMSDQGFFYRSDQFPFARYNIPSMWISAGENDDSGQKKYPNFWRTDYHTVRDEYDSDWSLEGLRQTVKLTLNLVQRMNEGKIIPRMKEKIPFPLYIK